MIMFFFLHHPHFHGRNLFMKRSKRNPLTLNNVDQIMFLGLCFAW
uniref:Uncharacterized protein n=1 Tax=Anopheles quadriannulatus TaxID=34691 RepID=A0A182XQS6_ANOQN